MSGAPSNNYLEMSDDDFSQMNSPAPVQDTPAEESETEEEQEEEIEEQEGEESPSEDLADESEEEASDDEEQEGSEPDDGAAGEPGGKPEGDEDEEADPEVEEKQEEKPAKPKLKPKKPEGDEQKTEAEGLAVPTDVETLQSFYKQIMAPFKANGKMIELKDPSEVISLMQMGANYTKKLQDIQPHRKMLLMLQNNDLLDEGKLSFLIDLEKRDPEAIKKLVKDAGIDPMDIDTSVEPDYRAGNHTVSDEEARFKESLEELTSQDTGKETLQIIDKTWDQVSKEALWASPEIMTIMHQQRETGVYDQITAEMNRQITLGQIPPNTPFLQAYKHVGDQLFPQAQQPGAPAGQPAAKPAAAPTKLAQKPATQKPKVANGEKASAAATSRGNSKKAAPIVNPLNMPDDVFMKQFENRL